MRTRTTRALLMSAIALATVIGGAAQVGAQVDPPGNKFAARRLRSTDGQ